MTPLLPIVWLQLLTSAFDAASYDGSILRLERVEKIFREGMVVLAGTFRQDNAMQEMFFAFPEEHADLVSDRADPFVPALLVPCMLRREPLEIDVPVSAALMSGADEFQAMFHAWFNPAFQRVEVVAQDIDRSPPPAVHRTASFFSLGVDSFFTLLKPRPSSEPLTHILFMRGLEIPLASYKAQWHSVVQRVAEVAAATGTAAITGETNLRDLFPLDWFTYYAGAGLAATALSLAPGFSRFLVPATRSWHDEIQPMSTSPLLDHLWSTESLTVAHDGFEIDRARKTAELGENELAMSHLRVCTMNGGGESNCGRCAKCVRTMFALKLAGRLDVARTFPSEMPREWFETVRNSNLAFAKQNLRLAEDLGVYDSDMRRLRRLVTRGQLRRIASDRSLPVNAGTLLRWHLYDSPRQGLARRLKAWRTRREAGP